MQTAQDEVFSGTVLITCKYEPPKACYYLRLITSVMKMVISYVVHDEYDLWKTLIDKELISRLPWKDVVFQWKLDDAEFQVTVKELNVRFVTFDPKQHSIHVPRRSVIPSLNEQLFDKYPLVHIYCIKCNDISTYKQIINPKLHIWMANIPKKSPLIILVTEPSSKLTKHERFKGSLANRVKSDFKLPTNRLIQISWKDESYRNQQDLWDRLIYELKEAVVSHINQYIASLHQVTHKLYMQKDAPGWNYLQYFSGMERIGHLWEHLRLYEQALTLYDGLVSCFRWVLSTSSFLSQNDDTTQSPFRLPLGLKDFGPRSYDIDSMSVLHLNNEAMIIAIRSNDISLFDLLCYCFYKQCRQILHMGRYLELLQRSIQFMLLMRDLFSITHTYNDEHSLFMDYWTFHFCQEIYDELSKYSVARDYRHCRYLGKLIDMQRYLVSYKQKTILRNICYLDSGDGYPTLNLPYYN
jgi:hypothetical protein